MLRVIELFSGVGSQTQALKNQGITHEVVATSDNDKFCNTSYCALHGDVQNLGDIRAVEQLPPADLWTYSFPCQDISVAGKGQGLDKGGGTRSGLLWEVERLLLRASETGTLPKYLLLENVKNLIGKSHKANYETWVAFLDGLGYTTYTKVLNAKHYGVPQNRERVFGVSILGDHEPYVFPEPVTLTTRLKDVLDDVVDQKFYLKESTIRSILTSKFNSRRDGVYGENDICGALRARDFHEPKCVVAGNLVEGKWKETLEMHRRVFDPNGIAPAITSCAGGNQEKKIIVDDLYPSREPRFYPENCPTLRSEQRPYKVMALRGRNPNDPKEWIQHLEMRPDDCTNTITSVQKDNLILTTRRTEYGRAMRKDYEKGLVKVSRKEGKEFVPRTDGISNTLTTIQRDNLVLETTMFNPYNDSIITDIAPTQTTNCGNVTSSSAVLIKTATKLGYEEAHDGDSINIAFPNSETRRGRVGKQIAQTIETFPHQAILKNCTIRKLTPTECWRLMGWKDEQIEKVRAVTSNAQMYKQAGNGIVVNVLEAIFKQLFKP